MILITARLEGGLEVAQRWQEGGAPGVTIIRSHGLHSLRQAVTRGDVELPLIVVSMAAAMASIIDNMEHNGMIALAVVEDEMIDHLVQTTTDVLGDLYSPNTGVLFVLPIERAYGVRDHSKT
jgi:hypothetical protein